MRVELWALRGARRRLLKKTRTNANGRTESPLLQDAEVRSGQYELVFFVGGYFKQSAPERFLDRVPVRFRLKAGESYHVPLLCSPWSYATYRGS
jgi:5-hydroxyisourate hydrolase